MAEMRSSADSGTRPDARPLRVLVTAGAAGIGRAFADRFAAADMLREDLGKVSLRRMIGARDIANRTWFLCSDQGGNISCQAPSVCGNVETL